MTMSEGRGTGAYDVRIALPDEIRRMPDAQAVPRMDALRAAAHEAIERGDDGAARAFLGNAAQIAQQTYLCTDAMGEYADFLEAHDLPELAGKVREAQRDVEAQLETAGPVAGYEDRLRSQAGARERESLETVVSQARAASEPRGQDGPPMLRLVQGQRS